MSDLLFIRHAETDLVGTFCGHSDPPVNNVGKLQIQKLLNDFPSQPIGAVYSSDLQRASSTAHALAASRAIPLFMRSSLREIHFGAWEGLTWAEIEERDPIYAALWLEQYPRLPAPRGEALGAFEARVLGEVASLCARTEYARCAIVTHAGVMRLVLRILCGIDNEKAWERTSSFCCWFLYSPAPQEVL